MGTALASNFVSEVLTDAYTAPQDRLFPGVVAFWKVVNIASELCSAPREPVDAHAIEEWEAPPG